MGEITDKECMVLMLFSFLFLDNMYMSFLWVSHKSWWHPCSNVQGLNLTSFQLPLWMRKGLNARKWSLRCNSSLGKEKVSWPLSWVVGARELRVYQTQSALCLLQHFRISFEQFILYLDIAKIYCLNVQYAVWIFLLSFSFSPYVSICDP